MLAFVTTPMKWTPQPSEPRWEPPTAFLDKLKGMALIASFIAVLAAFAMAAEWWETTWWTAVSPVRSEVLRLQMPPSSCTFASWWWWRESGCRVT
jgi:hypothetical protein